MLKLVLIYFGASCLGAKNVKGPGPIVMPHLNDDHDFDEEEKSTTPSYTSLWLASIWWEAGYQQGKSDSRSPTCNEIRVSMVEKDMFTEDQLPNCHTNGHWTPLQCGKTHCWCVFLDTGYRVQTIPYVGRNETQICPKLILMGKDPCRMTPTPLVTCKNTRSSRTKWIYDQRQEKCIYVESCTGFKTQEECSSTCVPQPISLCTLPLNEGNCTGSTKTARPPGLDSDVGLLSTITEKRFYFDRKSLKCKEFNYGRCGGNSNNFKSDLSCMGTCIKETQLTVMAKIGKQVLRLTLPAWLVVQLNLSPTEARDVPPTLVPMIFEHSFRSDDPTGVEGGVEVVQMESGPSQRGASLETEEPTQKTIIIAPRLPSGPKPIDFGQVAVAERCKKDPNPGHCRSWVPRWYYNHREKGCKVFGWGGCWGHADQDAENNFSGKYECVLKCAPIRNQNNQDEVNKWLAAGDPIDKPDQLVPSIDTGISQSGRQNFQVEYRGHPNIHQPYRPQMPQIPGFPIG